MSGKYILNNGTGELDIIPGQENKRTWLDKHEAKLGVPLNQPVLPFNPNEIKFNLPKTNSLNRNSLYSEISISPFDFVIPHFLQHNVL